MYNFNEFVAKFVKGEKLVLPVFDKAAWEGDSAKYYFNESFDVENVEVILLSADDVITLRNAGEEVAKEVLESLEEDFDGKFQRIFKIVVLDNANEGRNVFYTTLKEEYLTENGYLFYVEEDLKSCLEDSIL